MPNHQLVPGKGEMKRFLNAGLTQAQIVDAWEAESGYRVSRSAISMAMHRYDLQPSHDRPRYEEVLPWRVSTHHKDHIDARMLRLEGRRRTKGEASLAEHEARWLRDWKADLAEKNAVVYYKPQSEEGFYWVPASDAGEDTVDPNDEPTATRAG